MADSPHQVCCDSFVETTDTFFLSSPQEQFSNSIVFFFAGGPNELVLLDPGPHCGDGIAEEHGENFAKTSTNKVFFVQLGSRNVEFLIKDFGSFIDIHLDDSGKGKDKTELETLQEPFVSMLSIDLSDLFLAVVKLRNLLVDVQEHPSLDDPDRLGHHGGHETGLDGSQSYSIHGRHSVDFMRFLCSFVVPEEESHGGT